MRFTRALLVIIAVVCFGVALSYPIRYRLAQNENNANMEELSAMRSRAQQTADAAPVSTDAARAVNEAPEPEAEDAADATPEANAASETDAALEVDATKRTEASADAGVSKGGTVPSQAAPDASDGAPSEEAAVAAPEGDAEVAAGADVAAEDRPDVAAAVEVGNPPAGDDVQPDEGGEAIPKESAAQTPEGAEALLTETAVSESTPTPEPTPVADPSLEDLMLEGFATPTPTPKATPTPRPTPSPEPTPTPVWDDYTGPLPYPMLEKVTLDEDAILPELREIYELNHDLVGWIAIPGTVIDYPVVQTKDSEFYLDHDFYGNENINGQIILDTLCDPYTPSYNLVISGHHMKNGSMFGDLPLYSSKSYWAKHKFLEFDTLMDRKQYVVFAAFYSADYDENEEGFRYNANIQYKMDATQWLKEVEENQLYDTEVDVQFGDEFITLTTCNRARHRNGRFVVVCRRIREGETLE